MKFKSDFVILPQQDILEEAKKRQSDGWRYVQMLAVNNENSVDLVYSYMLNGRMDNLVVENVPRDAVIPSISHEFMEAFVCENEIHDLFGVKFDGIVIDFMGDFYRVSEEMPMTIISAAQLAEKQKQAKIEAAKKAKAEKDAKAAAEGGDKAADDGKDDKDADAELEAKLKDMDPEKAAKVRAAMEAKRKKEAAKEGGE